MRRTLPMRRQQCRSSPAHAFPVRAAASAEEIQYHVPWARPKIQCMAESGCTQIGHIVTFSRYRAQRSSHRVVGPPRKYHATPMTVASASVRSTSPCLTRFASSSSPGSGVRSECGRFATLSERPGRRTDQQAESYSAQAEQSTF